LSAGETVPAVGAETLRLDKWLWFVRLCKTRSLATEICRAGKVRVNNAPVRKSNHSVRVGDVLTFAQGPRIRVIRIRALASRRGPASEVAMLYDDLSSPAPPRAARLPDVAPREPGSGRPTKRDRRATDRLRDG
tara:strand:- start:1221 stop:1622 length:402 start_codon:yes stop_codon:yes gene_type:complete